jgi:PAP2 superfamily protein
MFPARSVRSGVNAAVATLACASVAFADAAPDSWRSTEYYVAHGALTAGLLAGGALTEAAREELEAGGDTVWFPGDAGLRGECSPEAAQLSDVSLVLSIGLPVGMELGRGVDARFVNAEIVYTEALLTTRLLTSAAKVIFRRPRPFSYRKDAHCAFDIEDTDAHMSFFSGHSSASFTAAVAGSLLQSETGIDRRTRAAIWGAEMALAGATANLRARAGKHYYSDIVVGALVGAGVGLVMPLLHGGDTLPSGSDVLAGTIGMVVGVGGSQLVALGAEAIDDGAPPSITFSPLPFASAVGAQAIGVF